MPVLSANYIGTWFHLVDPRDSSIKLVESYNTTATQELQAKPYLQGDVGTHVMTVGGIFYEYDFSSDALILLSGQTSDIISIISDGLETIRGGGYYNNVAASYLLENANISVSKQGVNAQAKFISDEENAWRPVYGDSGISDLIARTAQWYDCVFGFTSHTGVQKIFQIDNASLNITASVGKRFFIGTTQAPYFSVDSYTVTGKITLLVDPEVDIYLDGTTDSTSYFGIRPQLDNGASRLYPNGPKSVFLRVGNTTTIDLGMVSMIQTVNTTVRAGQITTATISFTAYAKFNTTRALPPRQSF
jgi:hypothetical protein